MKSTKIEEHFMRNTLFLFWFVQWMWAEVFKVMKKNNTFWPNRKSKKNIFKTWKWKLKLSKPPPIEEKKISQTASINALQNYLLPGLMITFILKRKIDRSTYKYPRWHGTWVWRLFYVYFSLGYPWYCVSGRFSPIENNGWYLPSMIQISLVTK